MTDDVPMVTITVHQSEPRNRHTVELRCPRVDCGTVLKAALDSTLTTDVEIKLISPKLSPQGPVVNMGLGQSTPPEEQG